MRLPYTWVENLQLLIISFQKRKHICIYNLLDQISNLKSIKGPVVNRALQSLQSSIL